MENPMNHKLGMTSVTFREKTIEEVAALAAKAGLSEIEWGGDRHVLPGDTDAVRRANEAMAKYGLVCPSYGSYYRFGDNDAAAFETICSTAKALGASTVRTWLGRRGSAVMPTEMRESILAEVRMLSDIAAKYGQTLAFEFHGKTLNDTGASSIAFLSECGKENVKTYWQPLSFSENENIFLFFSTPEETSISSSEYTLFPVTAISLTRKNTKKAVLKNKSKINRNRNV
jgi:sugar phosphate isomerase/epimerase